MEKFGQIRPHFWIGVFLYQKACRRVLDKQRQQTAALCPPGDGFGEFIKTWTACVDLKNSLHK